MRERQKIEKCTEKSHKDRKNEKIEWKMKKMMGRREINEWKKKC